MITKNAIKYVHSLSQKKYRDTSGCFVAENHKVVADLLKLLPCQHLYATHDFLAKQPAIDFFKVDDICEVSQAELERLSKQCTPHGAVAVFYKPSYDTYSIDVLSYFPKQELCLALDNIQDPGNLGTIVRIADWFGIKHIFASHNTADVFAPKVVQATMGAIGRVEVHYVDLTDLLKRIDKGVPIYGTFLNGNNLYEEPLPTPSHGIIIMGNEGSGISTSVEAIVSHRLLIPNYPIGRATSESLNVAVATAIICSEFRRQLTIHKQ